MSAGVEDDVEAMRYMRHECGHAINYAFRLYERPRVARASSARSRGRIASAIAPIRSRASTCGTSSAGTRRSIPTKTSPRRSRCGSRRASIGGASTPAGRRSTKLEYVDRVMREIGAQAPAAPALDRRRSARRGDALHGGRALRGERRSRADRRRAAVRRRPAPASSSRRRDAPAGEQAQCVHPPSLQGDRVANRVLDEREPERGAVADRSPRAARARRSTLRVGGLEASTLIELTAFGTAVVMNHRYTQHAAAERRRARAARRGHRHENRHAAHAPTRSGRRSIRCSTADRRAARRWATSVERLVGRQARWSRS